MFGDATVSYEPAVGEGRLCIRKSCGQLAQDDSDFCGAHEEQKHDGQRRAMKALRKLRRKNKLCARCGRVSKSRYRCTACDIFDGRSPSTGVTGGVSQTHAERVAARLIPWTETATGAASATNANRLRLRGGKRGKRSKNVEDTADIRDLEKYVEKGKAALAYFASPEVQALGQIAKRGAEEAALSWFGLAARTIATMHARHGVRAGELAADDDEG